MAIEGTRRGTTRLQLSHTMPMDSVREKISREEVTPEEHERSLGCSRHVKVYNSMWTHGQHFRIHEIDKTRVTQDSSIVASFNQLSQASVHDLNLDYLEVMYVEILELIIKVDYRIFK